MAAMPPSPNAGDTGEGAIDSDLPARSPLAPSANQEDGAAKDEASREDEEEEDDDDGEDDDDDDEEEEEEEPKLKYARLTGHLGGVYRNGDATSAILVAGDKMIIGTHNGNIHVIDLPSFRSLRVYHAHTASITSISMSPLLAPGLASIKPKAPSNEAPKTPQKSSKSNDVGNSPRTPQRVRTPQKVPNTITNNIYIATSSVDGKICVANLIDEKDVQLRDFARPVQAVALSPLYKSDRTYLSGGLAGNLVVTTGGKSGTSSMSTTTGTVAASATGWLGTIGLGTASGKDTILHSGEGTINNIKWSLSGKYVAWVNEHGIKVMRSNVDLETVDVESAWKRIAHIDRPQSDEWDEMASVWKGRIEWIDETSLETDDDDLAREAAVTTPATTKVKQQAKGQHKIEKLVVGWRGTIWLINIHPGGSDLRRPTGERGVGRAEIIKMLRMDCIISGLSLYTPTLLLVLAYTQSKDGDETPKAVSPKSHRSKDSTSSAGSQPSGGIRRKQNAQPPEFKLVDLNSSEEIEADNLTLSRFERLGPGDYHLGILPSVRAGNSVSSSRGTLDIIAGMGTGMWNATINATNILSSGASIRSGSDSDPSMTGIIKGRPKGASDAVHPNLDTLGMRIFIHSPYDCILATKRDLADHLSFLLELQKFEEAWQVVDDHPEVMTSSAAKAVDPTPLKHTNSDDFDDRVPASDTVVYAHNSAAEKEKRRIGELWLQQLVDRGEWRHAGSTCAKVLSTADRWKHWVYVFASADKFDEICDHVPTQHMHPPVPSDVYEIILAHYIATDRPKVKSLLETWPTELFHIPPVTTALEKQLKYRDVREDSMEGGEQGRDWRIVLQCLGQLYVADGRPRDALRCYMKLHDADAAMDMIKTFHLVYVVMDDLPRFVLLRVTKAEQRSASIAELQEITKEAIQLLVSEAQHGLLDASIVVQQLEGQNMLLYLYFFLKALWTGITDASEADDAEDRLLTTSRALVDASADLAVRLFATYDRDVLMDFLKASTCYNFEEATRECEARNYVHELVYLYSKTGQTKRALFLIIDSLHDVSQAIAFAKSQDDPDLWDDLLTYSMDKPRFIRGLLEEVGTTIDPVKLVRRIPEGLEIEGLREGLNRMVKDYVVQESISEGVAKVLRGEVSRAQNVLRAGQKKAVRFDVARDTRKPSGSGTSSAKAGRCQGCDEQFRQDETDTLVGFACGHVYHLRHLLDQGRDGEDERPPTPPREKGGGDADADAYPSATTRSVGTKVTHARLLRDRIRRGCLVCGAVT